MKTQDSFSFSRLYLLIRRQVSSNGRSLLIGFAGLAGILILISLVVGWRSPENLSSMNNAFFVVMFIVGFIISSQAFMEMHHPQKAWQYLCLPVSTTERLLSAWILTALAFPLLALTAMLAVQAITLIFLALAGISASFGMLLTERALNLTLIYIILQGVFLLGASWFKKNHLLNTLLVLFVFMTIFNSYAGLLGWALFGSLSGSEGMIVMGDEAISPRMQAIISEHIPAVFRFIFWYLTIPFFLITTWFSIKERQV